MKKKLIATAMLSAQTVAIAMPAVSSVVAFADDTTNQKTTLTAGQEVTEELVDGKSGLTQVLTVNGNRLSDKVTVNKGDNVTFDVVLTPGNQGLMKQFKDTLPQGLVFNPNSKSAITVYSVNNDGTVGDEITSEGTTVINGGTVTWTPKNPTSYFFAGAKGTRNRLLFHITTRVESGVASGAKLINTATTDFDNPKDPKNPPAPIKDTAEVEIPTNPKDPSIKKSVFKEAADGSISYDLPKDDTASKDGTTKTEPAKLAYEFSKDGKTLKTGDEATFLNQITKYAEEVTDYTEGKVDLTALNTAVENYKKDGSQENLVKVGEALKAIESEVAKVKGKSSTTTVKAENTHDNINLNDIAEKYSYVLDVKLPSRAISKSLEIRDDLEGVQSVDPANVHVYNSKGEDVTAKGAVKVEERKDKKVVTWNASVDYVTELNSTNTDKSLQMRITGVTAKNADKGDLKKLVKGGVVSIPNVAKVINDGIGHESNETLVRLPQDPENPTSTITKGVLAQDGKVDPKTGKTASKTDVNVPVDDKGQVKLPDGDTGGVITVSSTDKWEDLKAKSEKAIARAKVFGVDTKTLEEQVSQLNEKTDAKAKVELVKTFQTVSKAFDDALAKFNADREGKVKQGDKVADELTFETGQTQLDATKDTYFKYLINTSINPSELTDYLQITDPMDAVQDVKPENVRVYDATGKDVTDSFKVGVEDKAGKKVVTARANDEFVKQVKASKTNVKLQLVVYNVQAKSDKSRDIKNTADLELGKNKKLTSNETVVNLKVNEPAKPEQKPAQPDVKTGGALAKNPLVLGGVLVALIGGATAVFFSMKHKKKDTSSK